MGRAMNETDGATFSRIGFCLLAATALFFGLFVNGALPGFMVPTTGQAIWTLGFAQSFVNGSSIYATNFGLPNPAAISFGLAGALPVALFLKAGMPPADAYALAFALWLTVAFYGAYRFVRLVGAERGISLVCAVLWLTLPVIWQHSDYSMVSLGMALLPAYFYPALRLVRYECDLSSIVLFFGATLSSVFMDGYSFMMFASGTAVLLLFAFGLGWVGRLELSLKRGPIIVFSFAISYLLYARYIGKSVFAAEDINFFRAFGSNIEFFFVPTRGMLLLPDLLGLSANRDVTAYFGDGSVFNCSFALVLIVAAIYSLATKSADRGLKTALLLVALGGFYMALGPSFKLNVLKPGGDGLLMPPEYAPWRTGTEFLSLYLPGFNNMRASYRWVGLGLFGAWALLALHVASRRVQSGITVGIISVGIALNIPSPAVVTANIDSQRAILDIDRYVEGLRSFFKPTEKVAFLPFRNDFFANYMASKLGIGTYNVGGDKNFAAAIASWPDTMLAFEMGKTGPGFWKKVIWVLAKKDADVVAIPYIDLLWAVHYWPGDRQYFAEMQPYIDAIQSSDLVEVTRTDDFAFIRLKPSIRDLPRRELSALVTKYICKEGVFLARSSPLTFSNDDNVCGNGWSDVEVWGRWTSGKRATLHYKLAPDGERDVLEFDAHGFIGGDVTDQKVEVSINGKKSDQWEFTGQSPRRIERLQLPPGLDTLNLKFIIPNAKSPNDAGVSADTRTLGLGIMAVCLTKADETCLHL